MTQISPEEVAHLATLSRLNLSADEQAKFLQELPKIIDFVDGLGRVTLDAQAATKQVVELESLRSDEPASESLTLEQIGQLATPDFRDDQVVVPAVFGEAENA